MSENLIDGLEKARRVAAGQVQCLLDTVSMRPAGVIVERMRDHRMELRLDVAPASRDARSQNAPATKRTPLGSPKRTQRSWPGDRLAHLGLYPAPLLLPKSARAGSRSRSSM